MKCIIYDTNRQPPPTDKGRGHQLRWPKKYAPLPFRFASRFSGPSPSASREACNCGQSPQTRKPALRPLCASLWLINHVLPQRTQRGTKVLYLRRPLCQPSPPSPRFACKRTSAYAYASSRLVGTVKVGRDPAPNETLTKT